MTPENSKLEDPEERHRIATVFARGLTKPAGYVLPIQRWQADARRAPRWRSEKWKTRRGNLFLVPGDSPVGYRLPLGTLPYVPPTHYPYVTNSADPTVPRGPLPDFAVDNVNAGQGAPEQAVAHFTADEPGQMRVEQELGELDGAVRTRRSPSRSGAGGSASSCRRSSISKTISN